jgi:hypothetical protein
MTREEAIKVVRNIYQTDAEKEALETLIPELRESEDERIRKWLYDYIERVGRSWDIKPYTPFPYTQILAWIEKQKEQKHYWKPTETDVALFNKAVTTNKALTPTERAQLDIIRSKFGCCRAVNCSGIVQKEQKPEEWSDEDREIIDNAIKQLYRYADSYHIASNYTREKEVRKVAYELKSLRPSWKPSEDQMKHLHYALTPGSAFDLNILNELYEQLKKL